ncbi:MAG: hypothetical protein ACOCYV_02875 [Planctomycetota bacterium]
MENELIIVASVVAALVLLAIVLRMRAPRVARVQTVAVLRVRGAARVQAALALFRLLALGGDERRIERAWEEVEMPLIEALPDCPPSLKQPLALTLDDLHGCCRKRELQRRIMDVRNSLL